MKIFIGSTSIDLSDYRKAAYETCIDLQLIPIGMEHFGAMGVGATLGSLQKLEKADIYIGIFAHRYGYIEPGQQKSVTELEYLHARNLGLPRLCFLIDPSHPWPPEHVDFENVELLKDLKKSVETELIRDKFTTADNLKTKLFRALVNCKEQFPTQQTQSISKEASIEIELSGVNYDEFDTAKRLMLVEGLAQLVNIDKSEIKIINIKKGSIKANLLVPHVAAIRIGTFVEGNSEIAHILNIKKMTVNDKSFTRTSKELDFVIPQTKNQRVSTKSDVDPLFSEYLIARQIPAPVPDFVGRSKELEKLQAFVNSGSRVIGVTGLGGIGKSTLLFKFASLIAHNYPDGQFFIDMGNGLSAKTAVTKVVRSFNSSIPVPNDEFDLYNLFRSLLNNRRVVFLLDNLNNKTQLEPFLSIDRSLLLFSSRQNISVPGLKKINLGGLSKDDAIKLVEEIDVNLSEHAARISELCQFHPLAIRILTTNISNNPVESPARILDEFAINSNKTATVEEYLDATLAQIDTELAAKWLKLAAFEDNFNELAVGALWSGLDTKTEFYNFIGKNIVLDEVRADLSELVKNSLLEWNPQSRRYRMHDLLKDFAKSRIQPQTWNSIKTIHSMLFQAMLSNADEMFKTSANRMVLGLSIFDNEFENIQGGRIWANQNKKNSHLMAEIASIYAIQGINILSIRLPLKELIKWLEDGLDAAKLISNTQLEAYHLGNIGNVYYLLGDFGMAIKTFEQVKEVAISAGDLYSESKALFNIAKINVDSGLLDEGLKLTEKSLEISKIINQTHQVAGCLMLKGSILGKLDKLDDAIRAELEALDLSMTTGYIVGRIDIYHQLGNLYVKKKDVNKALEYFRMMLEISRYIKYEEAEADALYSIGLLYTGMGRKQEALELINTAIKKYAKVDSPAAKWVEDHLKTIEDNNGKSK